MKTLGILLLLGALGLGATWMSGGFEGEAGDAERPSDGLFQVKRGVLNVTLTENGTLVAQKSNKISSDTDRGAKITWLIDEGSEVQEGDVVCRLDTSDLEDRVEQLELDINQANANLKTANTNLEIQLTDNIAEIEKAEIALVKAQNEEERYTDGDAPKERRNLEVAIKEAQTNFTRAKKRFEDSQLLMEKEYINRSQFEEDEIAFERNTVQLEGAKRDLELFEQYNFPMTVTERSAAVRDGERNLETAKKRAESNTLQKEVAVDEYTTRLNKLRDQRDEAVEQIGKMTLVSTAPGIVIYGDPSRRWRSSDEIRVGADIWGDQVVATIPDLRVMQVNLRVHEADIGKLAKQQKAKITLDTYPGVVFDGEVTNIGNIAGGDNPWERNPEVKKFDVEVTLTGGLSEQQIRPGVSAKVEVFIDRKDDVLFVPIQCVVLEEGRHMVYVMEPSGLIAPRDVQPGIGNEVYVEILDGLEPGDRVLLYNPNVPSGSTTDSEAVDSEESDASEAASAPASKPPRGGRGKQPGAKP
ncbi:MAG: hypothetical protein DHS20C15_16640 [Planctomycetota bacterium]|nr:MAG: hypothetical protein DHS20C15_16640 [Planctomycetota bacterium]